MDSIKNSQIQKPSEDADLGLVLYKSGQTLKQFSSFLRASFSSFFRALLAVIFFFMKNILWLLLGALLGLIYGFYLLKTGGTMYYAEMTVKANFNSSVSLYNTINYFNALANKREAKTLSSIFSINEQEANQLVSFSVQPIKSDISTTELYKKLFLEQFRSQKLRQDTFWTRTINYEDFKQSLTNYDYPGQKVTAISSNPFVFSKLENGIIAQVSGNILLKQTRDKQVANNKTEEQTIITALKSLDTLRKAYNERISKETPGNSSGNNITMFDGYKDVKIPELELYDKMLELLDELKATRQRSVTENDIIEVYSKFNPIGQELSLFRQNIAKYTLIGFTASLLILILIALYKYLSKLEKKLNTKAKA